MKLKFNIWGLLFVFILIYFIFVLREDIQRHKSLVKEKKDLIKRISLEKNRKIDLKKTAYLLEQNDFIMDLARQRLNLIGKGEKAYKVCRTR